MIRNIIGLGTAGCNLALEFQKLEGYKVYKIGRKLSTKDKQNYILQNFSKPEEYEENPPKLKTFFRLIKGEVLFIVGGASYSSNASLVILEQLRHCKINILYIKPDQTLLNSKQEQIERLTYNVFQEYARSGVFQRIYLVDNVTVEALLGDTLDLDSYYEMINKSIVSTINAINSFSSQNPDHGKIEEEDEISRIATFGIIDLENKAQSLLFPIDNIIEKVYYYVSSKKKSGRDVLDEIREIIKKDKEAGIKVSYGIYPSFYEKDYICYIAYSSQIQK